MFSQPIKTIKEFNKRVNKNIKESFFLTYFYRPVALPITMLLVKTPVTANQTTIFMILFCLASIILFGFGDYYLSLLGSVLLIFSYVLDCVDGQMARYRKKISIVFVVLVDGIFHKYVSSLIFLLVPLGIYINTGNHSFFIFGFLAATANIVFSRAVLLVDWLIDKGHIDKALSPPKTKSESNDFRLVNLSNKLLEPLLCFGGSLFVLLFFAFINQLGIFVVFYGILFPVRLFVYTLIQLIKFHPSTRISPKKE